MKPITKFEIKSFYTMQDMASYLGYSRKGARGFITKLNVPIFYIGNRAVIYLTDLQSHCPEFFSSLLEAANLNSLISESVEDVDQFQKAQFK